MQPQMELMNTVALSVRVIFTQKYAMLVPL